AAARDERRAGADRRRGDHRDVRRRHRRGHQPDRRAARPRRQLDGGGGRRRRGHPRAAHRADRHPVRPDPGPPRLAAATGLTPMTTAPIPAFHLYDTTLRDGSQQEGLTLSVADKLAVARHLDDLGVTYIEGGWPGAVPRDTEFGATRKAGLDVAEDPQVAALVDSGAPTITLVAKSDLRHVTGALRTTAEENLAMVRDTVAHLVGLGREVFVDAEHFFDGFLHDA